MKGFSYIEVLIATAIVAMVLVPTMEALNQAIGSNQLQSDQAAAQYSAFGKMEELLATPFSELLDEADSAANPNQIVKAYSDPPGQQQRRLVFLSRYDVDNLDGDNDEFTDETGELIWVKVQIRDTNISFESLARSGP